MKTIKRISVGKVVCLLFASFFIFMPRVVAGGEDPLTIKLTIPSAISMAFEASEDLKMSENAILRKRSEQKEEFSDGLPQVSASASVSNNFEYPDTAATAAMNEYYLDSGVTVSQTIFAFGRISNAVSAAKKAVDASRLNKANTEQNIIYNTKVAYFNALLAKRILEISEESYENAKQNKKILEDRSALGRVSKYDNIKISADISSRLPSVNNARANFVSALETLKVTIGASSGDMIDFVEGFAQEFSDFNRDALAAALYNNQPALKGLAETIKEKERLVKSKKAAFLPELSAFGTWNRKGYDDDYDIGSDNLEDYGVAGVKVSVPVWLGGLDQEKLSQARIDKRDAELQYTKGQKDYLLLLDKSLAEYREYLKTLEANNEAVRLAEESFKYSQDLFGSGQVSVTDLNDAELQLTHARISKETTLFNLNVVLAQIHRLALVENTYE